MADYFKLLRVKHYIKNLLVFVPLFFARKIFAPIRFWYALIGMICFCLISSAVYILNDIRDAEKDRHHPRKKERPIASGRISKKKAVCILIMCIVIALLLSLMLQKPLGIIVLMIYFGINVAYSMGLKNKPIVDIAILTCGFVLRIIYGGILTDVVVSKWLYYVIIAGAMYMGLGKRRNELMQQTDMNTREVLKYYTSAFLDKNMYVCVTLVIVFYSLWAAESICPNMFWSVPIIIIILMKYSLDVERDSDGDPVEVLLHDKMLIFLVVCYVVYVFALLYAI